MIIIIIKQKENKKKNLKSNINVKAMTSGEHQKSFASNLLFQLSI